MAQNQSLIVQNMPRPLGKFPHARRGGDYIFVSGTSARQPDNSIEGAEVDESGSLRLDIRAQTHAVIRNIARVLAACDAGLEDVVEICTYLTNMNDFAGYNDVYAGYFGFDGPARTTVAAHQLPHPHLLIEMKAVAYKPLPSGAPPE